MGGAHAVLAVAILANGALGMAVVLVTRFPEHPALLRALLPFGVVGLNRSLTLVLSLLLVYLAFEVYERSEEHTSELQSHSERVCRLRLEKKKSQHQTHSDHVCRQLLVEKKK